MTGQKNWYSSDYSDEDLARIAELAHGLVARGAKRVYIFFNNDFGGYAPVNSLGLQQLLEE